MRTGPRLVDKTSLGQGSSTQVNYDHHAFLYWPQTGLAVLPVQIYPTSSVPPVAPLPTPATGTTSPSGSGTTQGFTGAIGFHIDSSGIQEVGQISHPSANGYTQPITRSIVIGNVLYSLSDQMPGSSHRASTHSRPKRSSPFLPFPRRRS